MPARTKVHRYPKVSSNNLEQQNKPQFLSPFSFGVLITCVYLFWSFLFYDQVYVCGVQMSPFKRLKQSQVPLTMEAIA
jgi:hypothetical protein